MQAVEADTRWKGRAPARLAAALLVLALLPLTSLHSYLLFHSLAEVAFAVVAFSVLVMAWTLRSFLDDDFPVFLGVALAAAGLLHLLHMVDFPGADMITASFDPPTQLWIAARLLTAVSLVVAPFVLGRRIRVGLVFFLYLALDVVIVLSVYWWRIFPSMLSRVSGLTRTKMVSEYVICALFLLAMWLLWRRRSRLPGDALWPLLGALAASVVAELFFTLYRGPHTWPNLVGHLFLGLSAVLVYLGVIEDGLARPHGLVVAGLREAQALHQRLEQGLLPSFDLRRDDLTLAGQYRSGERRLRLAGDFLDVLDLGDEGLAVICGDVSGHGPDAAALGTMLRVSWEALVLSRTPPVRIVDALSEVLLRERPDEDTFATLCLAWLDPRDDEIELISLGHPLPLITDGSVRRLEARPMPPLGVLTGPLEEPARHVLPPRWQVLFYTDGLIEGRARPGSSERYGEAGLITALEAQGCQTLDEACLADLVDDIERTSGEPFADDVTVVVIGKRLPAEDAAVRAAGTSCEENEAVTESGAAR